MKKPMEHGCNVTFASPTVTCSGTFRVTPEHPLQRRVTPSRAAALYAFQQYENALLNRRFSDFLYFAIIFLDDYADHFRLRDFR
ncbi:TPA: hypothetical protein U2L31_007947 [Burkholderia contaminans]|nr:hypothetical protein [Burkholderia contaminans]